MNVLLSERLRPMNIQGDPLAAYTAEQRDLIKRMREGGWSLQRIASIGGPSDETLRKMRDGGGGTRPSWDRLRAALRALESEDEDFADAGEGHHATVELHDIFGIGRVVVPVEDENDADDLEDRIARVVRGIRKGMAQ